MPEGPATILGGLPVWVEASAGVDDNPITGREYWSEVDALYWLKKDGTKGSPIPQKVWDRAEEYDYGFCTTLEQLWDHLSYEQYERDLMDVRCSKCEGTGVSRPYPWAEPTAYCRRCKGTGTFVSRVRAGLPEARFEFD